MSTIGIKKVRYPKIYPGTLLPLFFAIAPKLRLYNYMLLFVFEYHKNSKVPSTGVSSLGTCG